MTFHFTTFFKLNNIKLRKILIFNKLKFVTHYFQAY